MDYTKSNGFTVDSLTGQRLHKEAQAVPTALSDKDINGIIWSMMEVVKDGGLAGVQFDPAVPTSYKVFVTAIKALISAAGSEQPGRVSIFWQPTAPAGWTAIDGGLLTRSGYPALWEYVQQVGAVSETEWQAGAFGRFSYGDGASTFRKPDVRGYHLRASDQGRGIDPGRVLWSIQQAMLGQHVHGLNDTGHGHGNTDLGHGHGVNDAGHVHTWGANSQSGVAQGTGNAGSGNSMPGASSGNTSQTTSNVTIQSNGSNITVNTAATGITVQSTGGIENRVVNIAVPYYMKY